MESVSTLITLLVGLFGGAGATLLWETVIKPSRDSRAFARLLLAELTVNRVTIAFEIEAHDKDPGRLPARSAKLYSTIFNASANRLADLPLGVAAPTYWAYRYVYRINDIRTQYWDFTESHSPVSDPERMQVFHAAAQANYMANLRNSLPYIDRVRTALEYASLPIWSMRRRRLKARVGRLIADMEKVTAGPEPKPRESGLPPA